MLHECSAVGVWRFVSVPHNVYPIRPQPYNKNAIRCRSVFRRGLLGRGKRERRKGTNNQSQPPPSSVAVIKKNFENIEKLQ